MQYINPLNQVYSNVELHRAFQLSFQASEWLVFELRFSALTRPVARLAQNKPRNSAPLKIL
jgi:hypothetical protein